MANIMSGSISNQRLMHFALVVAQGVLGCVFAAIAVLKLLFSFDRVVEIMNWTASLPPWSVRALGAVELIAAILVAAPVVTEAPQRIVGSSAALLCALMTTIAALNLAHGDLRMLPVNLAIAALALFVAWGRLTREPLESLESR